MKLIGTASIILAAGVVFAQSAAALSEDSTTINAASGAARFTDPDDQIPNAVNLTGSNGSTGSVDPSSVRYDYDPTSGAYVPHKQ